MNRATEDLRRRVYSHWLLIWYPARSLLPRMLVGKSARESDGLERLG
jgi:hypothetical protein